MADLEKVIDGLNETISYLRLKTGGVADRCIQHQYDAIELLKEQEPVHVIQREAMHMLFWCCGSCGVAITEGDKFCRMCGRAVKWNDCQ